MTSAVPGIVVKWLRTVMEGTFSCCLYESFKQLKHKYIIDLNTYIKDQKYLLKTNLRGLLNFKHFHWPSSLLQHGSLVSQSFPILSSLYSLLQAISPHHPIIINMAKARSPLIATHHVPTLLALFLCSKLFTGSGKLLLSTSQRSTVSETLQVIYEQ